MNPPFNKHPVTVAQRISGSSPCTRTRPCLTFLTIDLHFRFTVTHEVLFLLSLSICLFCFPCILLPLCCRKNALSFTTSQHEFAQTCISHVQRHRWSSNSTIAPTPNRGIHCASEMKQSGVHENSLTQNIIKRHRLIMRILLQESSAPKNKSSFSIIIVGGMLTEQTNHLFVQ